MYVGGVTLFWASVFSKVKGNLVHQTHEITSLLDQRISVGSIDTNPISHMHPGYTKVPLCLLLLLLLPISSKFLIIFLYIYIYITYCWNLAAWVHSYKQHKDRHTHAQLSKSSFLAQIINQFYTIFILTYMLLYAIFSSTKVLK